ncbi:hypothetical protein MRB53_011114 [Persea americana]|uniref:Uncharacterized protein n=1 Tax=Persea americana TaxID=3435 RepID=A0ACC2LTZ2_PERAE|nr:hypothetical protein MRB53_011114 [Persea americana]
MDRDSSGVPLSTFSVALIGVLSVAVMLMIYHCILVRCCKHRDTLSQPRRPQFLPQEEGTPSGQERSFIQLIPAYKYGKEPGEAVNTCAVCLCEFKEGEDVRRLPECLHSFHVPCIDMWLYSHSSCPLCRAEMAPPPVLTLTPTAPPYLISGLPNIGG